MMKDSQSKDFPLGTYEDRGFKFGRLSLLEIYMEGKYKKGSFLCDCGNKHSVRFSSVLAGESKSCGCYSREMASERAQTHGLSRHRLADIWYGVCKRCLNKKRKDYPHYGGRGIKICPEWHPDNPDGLKNFIKDMDGSYTSGLEIERKDVNGNYCKDNCTWVTRRSQTNNFRHTVKIEYKGVELGLSEWAYLLGISRRTLQDRLGKLGWDTDTAITTPHKNKRCNIYYKGNTYTVMEFIKALDIKHSVYLEKRKKSPTSWVEDYGAKMDNPYITLDPDKVISFIRTGEGYDGDDYAMSIFEKYKEVYGNGE